MNSKSEIDYKFRLSDKLLKNIIVFLNVPNNAIKIIQKIEREHSLCCNAQCALM